MTLLTCHSNQSRMDKPGEGNPFTVEYLWRTGQEFICVH